MIGLLLAAVVATADPATTTLIVPLLDTRYVPNVQSCWTPLSDRPPEGVKAPVGGCVWSPTPDVDERGAKLLGRSTGSISVAMDERHSLAFGAPPCGTPEAKEAEGCIIWKVVPCPSAQAAQSQRIGPLFVQESRPIGCPQ